MTRNPESPIVKIQEYGTFVSGTLAPNLSQGGAIDGRHPSPTGCGQSPRKVSDRDPAMSPGYDAPDLEIAGVPPVQPPG